MERLVHSAMTWKAKAMKGGEPREGFAANRLEDEEDHDVAEGEENEK